MSIKNKIKNDIAKLTVTDEVEALRVILTEYLIKLDKYLFDQSGMNFDYCGGCFSSHGYFDFDRNVTILETIGDVFTTINILYTPHYSVTFKFNKKHKMLNYWSHTVKSKDAKQEINSLIYLIGEVVKELS